MWKPYDIEEAKAAVAASVSIAGAVRLLGRNPVGGTTTQFGRFCKKNGIDTSHFTGQGHMKNKVSNKRADPLLRLVLGVPENGRMDRRRLHQSLQDLGRKYCCVECGNEGVWRGKQLVLEIDHINEKFWDNRPENLQYLYPQCHSVK